jgi:hypothetical protein
MPAQEHPPFTLPPHRIDALFELVTKLARGGKQGSFRVYPPQLVIDNPGILNADDAIVDRLRDTTWQVRFYDGHLEKMTFVELMTFRHLINDVRGAMGQAEIDARQKGATPAQPAAVDRRLHIPSIMSPPSVKRLLTQLTLQPTSTPS